MSKVLIVIMVASAAIMVFGLVKQKQGMAWGKPLATLAAVIALVCALSHIVTSGGPSQKSVMKTQMRYVEVSTEKLGQYLAEKYPGKKALLIVSPMAKINQANADALTSGLKRGLDGKITIVAEVSPEPPKMPNMPAGPQGKSMPPGAEMMMMGPIEFWLTPEKFDAMLEPHLKNVDLVITTIGLPMEVGKLKFWQVKPQPPKMVIASGNISNLAEAIKAGYVAAAVTFNPKATYDNQKPPSNLDDAFSKRYLLVTPENVEQTVKEFPNLFMGMMPPGAR
jgi:hypothetical protein